ncbi:MAG TPA: cytochrome o ubiquinol oxidase subunit IV [Candidatus Saccharimonadales bacterium]
MNKRAIVSHHEPPTGNLASYTLGFVLSIALTVLAYLLVVNHSAMRHTLLVIIIVMALVQFLVQLIFFLHLGTETKPRWKLLAFGFMVMTVAILVFGSLWIMDNLNYHMMSPAEENTYLHDHEGL